MPKNQILPREGMTAAERKTFAHIVSALAEKGIDPAPRSHMIEDFVFAETTLRDLRSERKRARGKDRIAITRAINVSTAERRRIHEALFAPEKHEKEKSIPDAFGYVFTEADIVWIQFFAEREIAKSPDQIEALDARKRELTEKYGEPTLAAIVTHKDQLASRASDNRNRS